MPADGQQAAIALNGTSTHVCTPLLEQHLALNVLVVGTLLLLWPYCSVEHVFLVISVVYHEQEFIRHLLFHLDGLVIAYKLEDGLLARESETASNVQPIAYLLIIWYFIGIDRSSHLFKPHGRLVIFSEIVRQEGVVLCPHGAQDSTVQAFIRDL